MVYVRPCVAYSCSVLSSFVCLVCLVYVAHNPRVSYSPFVSPTLSLFVLRMSLCYLIFLCPVDPLICSVYAHYYALVLGRPPPLCSSALI